MNKKQLYESIMRNVSREVKKAMNESISDIPFSNRFKEIIEKWLNTEFTGKSIEITFLNNDIVIENDSILTDVAGYLIEGYVHKLMDDYGKYQFRNELSLSNDEESQIFANFIPTMSNLYRRGDKKHYDFDFTMGEYSYPVEIKSYKIGNKAKLSEYEMDIKDNVIYIFVGYKVENNKITIKRFNVSLGDSIEITINKDKSGQIGVTRMH